MIIRRRSFISLLALTLAAGLVVPGPRSAAALRRSGPKAVNAETGQIAYVGTNGAEIHVVNPDGTNDHIIFSVPTSSVLEGIRGVAWRPDGAKLAFASDHEMLCSFYQSEIYTINPNGSGLQRITDGPDCSQLGSYSQGTVTLQVTNVNSSISQWAVYIQGASLAQQVSVPQGATVNVTFNNVAALTPGHMQFAVAVEGDSRVFDAAAGAIIVPGQTVSAGTLHIYSGLLFGEYGAYFPTWSPDASMIGFYWYQGGIYYIPTNAPPLDLGSTFLDPSVSVLATSAFAWSPNSNQIVYEKSDVFNGNGIYEATLGAKSTGTLLVSNTSFLQGINWLPDASGFVFGMYDIYGTSSNIFHYDIASDTVTQVTQYSNQYAALPSASPDGQVIVFQHSPNYSGGPFDLQTIAIDGTSQQALGPSGVYPSWSRVSPPTPRLYTPFVKR